MITASSLYAANARSTRSAANVITRRNAVAAANTVAAAFGAQKSNNISSQSALFDQFIPHSQGFSIEDMISQNMQNPPFAPANSSVQGLFLDSDRPLVERTLRAFGLTERDDVRVFVIPRSNGSRRGLQAGSFIHRPTTSRQTDRISRSIRRLSTQIRDKELGISESAQRAQRKGQDAENKLDRELSLMRIRLAEYRQLLRREQQRLANGPRRGWIVVERDE